MCLALLVLQLTSTYVSFDTFGAQRVKQDYMIQMIQRVTVWEYQDLVLPNGNASNWMPAKT